MLLAEFRWTLYIQLDQSTSIIAEHYLTKLIITLDTHMKTERELAAIENARMKERSKELINQEVPERDGWSHGIRLDSIYRLEFTGTGIRVYMSWNGIAHEANFAIECLPDITCPESRHADLRIRRTILMNELLGNQ